MNLKEKRAQAGLSQARLADVLGVSRNTVARWETGERTPTGLARRALEAWILERNRAK